MTPQCPHCQSKKTRPNGHRMYYCTNCKMLFDDDPGEGGDYSNRNPAARLEREERQRDKQRRNGRPRRW